MVPVEEPMLPVEETAPLTVSEPPVEVTVPPDGIVSVDVAVKEKPSRLKVPLADKLLMDEAGVALKLVDVLAGITTSSPFVGM